MDVVMEPFSHEREVPFGDFFVPVGVGEGKGLKELSGIEITQGIGGKVAEGSHGPVDVLEASFCIGVGGDSEELFHFCVPGVWEVADGEGAFDEG